MAEHDTNSSGPSPALSQVWQLPVLLLGVALFGAGLWLARPGDPTPKYAEALDQIHRLIVAAQYQQAIDELKAIESAVPTLPIEMQGRFFLLAADVEYLQQQAEGWNLAENHKKILANYRKAEQLGQTLDAAQQERLARTLASLGRDDAALAVLANLGEAGYAARQALLRRMIGAAMSSQPPRLNEAEHLIKTLQAEPGLTEANSVWLVARQADLLMQQGDSDRAVESLLRHIRFLTLDNPDAPVGELAVQLGKAYLAEGDPANAERWLLRARQILEAEDPLNADAITALGRIRFNEGNIVEALEHFTAVVTQFDTTQHYRQALVGKAECEARLGSFDQAMSDYEIAVKLFADDVGHRDDRLESLRASLSTQQELRFGEGQYDQSLRLLELERRLYAAPLPTALLLKLARTHEELARQSLGLRGGESDTPEVWAKAAQKQRERAAEHFAKAADYFLAHARAVTIQSDEGYGESLWRAGDYYDKSGLYKRAIDVFGEYRQGRPDDPRGLAAAHRLGRAYQAAGRYDEAVVLYKQLIEEHPKAPEAYQSLVPLATSYLAKTPPQTGEAEQVLRSVVEDHPALRPESREYREAIIALGQLYYRRGDEGDYERAIERLNEAVSRYGDDDRVPQLQFQLGDAYRKSVHQLDAKLAAGTLPPSKKMAMVAERARRLDESQQNFDAVITALERPAVNAALDDLGRLYLRNSYFYRADCAFDLARYDGPDGAIELYERALQKYDRDPAALVALVQIVNCYAALGQHDKARVVNERAKVLLKRIPDERFNDPNLPMDRYHWQRWLDWTSQLSSAETKP